VNSNKIDAFVLFYVQNPLTLCE